MQTWTRDGKWKFLGSLIKLVTIEIKHWIPERRFNLKLKSYTETLSKGPQWRKNTFEKGTNTRRKLRPSSSFFSGQGLGSVFCKCRCGNCFVNQDIVGLERSIQIKLTGTKMLTIRSPQETLRLVKQRRSQTEVSLGKGVKIK